MLVRKKPIIVDAWQLNHLTVRHVADDQPELTWVHEAYKNGDIVFCNGAWSIPTYEGIMKAFDGDYLIRGVHKELYACRSDVFWETYEVV